MRYRIAAIIIYCAGRAACGEPLAPNENLIVSGIPELSPDLSAALRYDNFTTTRFLSWHPRERKMLVRRLTRDGSQIFLLDKPGAAPRPATRFPGGVIDASYCPAGKYFVFSADSAGDERIQFYRWEPEGKPPVLITDGKSRHGDFVWNDEGTQIAYTSTQRNGRATDIFTMDPLKPENARAIAQNDSAGWRVLDWSRDGRVLALQTFSVSETTLWTINSENGSRTMLLPAGEKTASCRGAQFSPDGRVFLNADLGSGFHRIFYIEANGTIPRLLSGALQSGVASFDLSSDGKRVACITHRDNTAQLNIIDVRSEKAQNILLPQYSEIHFMRFSENNELAVRLSSSQTPLDVFTHRPEDPGLERWTDGTVGANVIAEFADPEPIRWNSFDGRRISGFIYRPKEFNGPRPVLISIHGGPEEQFLPTFLGASNYFLNELGVALICPNVRGSVGFGSEFATLDNGLRREDAVKDIGALLDWIAIQPELDANRVMVTGTSYGGYMSLAVAAQYSEKVRCAISEAGITNFVSFLENTEAGRRDQRRAEYGDEREPEMRLFLKRISPLTNASKITKPLFLIHGVNDPRVPPSEAEQMASAVRKQGVTVWTLFAKNEGHGIVRKENWNYRYCATIEFMRRFLLE